MIVIGVLFILIGAVIIYWNISYSPYKSAFDKQMMERVDQTTQSEDLCTADEISKLPEPLQRFSNYIELENSPKHNAVNVVFPHTPFVFNAESGKILDMDYDLWLFYDKPFRSAYCTSSMFGVPFDGIDYCNEGIKEAGMKGIIGKTIQIFDVHTNQGYQAQLISWLAESLTMNPSIILSPYITYETIDDSTVKATVEYNGVTGSGEITINEMGQVTEFFSDERQVENVNGVETKVGWRCEYENYISENGVKRASTVRSIKVFADKEVTYFSSDQFKIDLLK